jgi:histone deacetylase 11
MNDERVFIMDMYNRQIYPRDYQAKNAIRCKIELEHNTNDKTYLRLLHLNLEKCLNEFQPDFIVYNAGTDILQGDPLGNLDITPEVYIYIYINIRFIEIKFDHF